MENRPRKAPAFFSCGVEFGYGALLLIFFAFGVLSGRFLCDRMNAAEELALYLSAFLTHSSSIDAVSPWVAASLYFRYPLLVLGLTLIPLGAGLLPLFMLFIGAELSFSVAAFLAAFGKSGVWVALCVLGIRSVLVLPCCFVLAFRALPSRRQGKPRQVKKTPQFLCLAGVLGAGILFEIFLVPQLLSRVLAGMNF